MPDTLLLLINQTEQNKYSTHLKRGYQTGSAEIYILTISEILAAPISCIQQEGIF